MCSKSSAAQRLRPPVERERDIAAVATTRDQHGSSAATNNADAPHSLALLRPRRERPRGRAAEQRDELAPFQLTKLHALTPAKVTAYWIGEHQVRGLPPCGISVRPMTVQGQSEPKGAAKYNRFRAGMAGKQTRNQCMMFRNSWQGSAKAGRSPLALFGRPSFVDPN
jgi:hypothetical protein